LSFSEEDGFLLRLIGGFDPVVDRGPGRIGLNELSKSYPIIIGLTDNDKQVTLEDCMGTGWQIGMPGFERQTYKPRVAYFGFHAATPEDLQFDQVAIGFSHLSDWVAKSGFVVQVEFDDESEFKKYSFEYSQEKSDEYPVNDCVFSIRQALKTEGSRLRGISARELKTIHISSPRPISFADWGSNYLVWLQNLLTLATVRTNSITELSVFKEGVAVTRRDGESRRVPIETVFRTSAVSHKVVAF
jgi:hypothetical protein